MRSLRSRSARLAMVAAVLCWIAGLGAQVVHNAVERHAVCEHGELVEISEARAQKKVQILAQSQVGDHAHGCAFDSLHAKALQSPGITAPAVVHPVHEAPLLARYQAPRGPPLGFAPKTGPPAA